MNIHGTVFIPFTVLFSHIADGHEVRATPFSITAVMVLANFERSSLPKTDDPFIPSIT